MAAIRTCCVFRRLWNLHSLTIRCSGCHTSAVVQNEEQFLKSQSIDEVKAKIDDTDSAGDHFVYEPSDKLGNFLPVMVKQLSKEKIEAAFDFVKKLMQEKAMDDEEYVDLYLERPPTGHDPAHPSKRVPMIVRPIDIEKLPEDKVLELLKKSIIFNNYGLVVLNKPFGLTYWKGKSSRYCLQQFLPELAKHVDANELHLVHQLDKEVTGILLLVKDKQLANEIRMLYKLHKIHCVYWAITKGVPSPLEGTIDEQLMEEIIGDDIKRLVIKPRPNEQKYTKQKLVHRYDAVTHYRVLTSTKHAALVQVLPQTVVGDQIRAHLGLGMGSPIIGDHKYSYVNEVKAQKLPNPTLSRLHTTQTLLRDLKLYLHMKEMIIPEIANGRNVYLRANLSRHFKCMMHMLLQERNDSTVI